MKDKILKWWNREWSDWSPYKIVNTFSTENLNIPIYSHQILIKHSNDGLVKYKKIKIC